MLNFYGEIFYNYGICELKFKVNFNKLYNSNILIQFNNINITDCIVLDDFYSINCYYEFSTQNDGEILNLKFNGENTKYYITIKTPSEFSEITNLYRGKNYYYMSLTGTNFFFRVDSSYKIEKHQIDLVPSDPKNDVITLSSCKFFRYGIQYVQCSGILNSLDNYYVFFDNKNSSFKLIIYPEPTSINNVLSFEPFEVEASSSEIIFTLIVDYVVNLNKAIFTLIDSFNNNNKFYLTKCLKVKSETEYYKITCVGTITKAGCYGVYLNGIKQNSVRVDSYNKSLTKAFYIWLEFIKFKSSTTPHNIEIWFDSTKRFESKNISLKGTKNTATLTIKRISDYLIYYDIIFPAPDIYYLYIDNINQDLKIIVSDNFKPEVVTITPTFVIADGYFVNFDFILTFDVNLETSHIKLELKKNVLSYDCYCEVDSLNKTKANCVRYGEVFKVGEYYVVVNGKEFPNIKVTGKTMNQLYSYSPISIIHSSKSQTIILNFKDIITNYINKVTFVNIENNETLNGECSQISNYSLSCLAIFKKEGKYYITINDVNYGRYINVNEKDNINEEEQNNDNNMNYIKITSALLLSLLIFI